MFEHRQNKEQFAVIFRLKFKEITPVLFPIVSFRRTTFPLLYVSPAARRMPMSLRDSIFSIGSRMLQRYDDDLHFDGACRLNCANPCPLILLTCTIICSFPVMTDEELQEMQDDLLQSIWVLTLENDVYERYLTRHNPSIMRSKHFLNSTLMKYTYTR